MPATNQRSGSGLPGARARPGRRSAISEAAS